MIDRIIVFAMAKDLRLARICISSIRYWYPTIPISLVKDEKTHSFDTSEIENHWGVTVERCGQTKLGGVGFLIKLEPLFLGKRERILMLDSDTVFAGPVIDTLAQSDAQFIVSPDTAHGVLDSEYGRQIVNSFLYDFEHLQKLDRSFKYPQRMFNAGHIVITTGIYKKQDLSFFFDWTLKPTPKFPRLFQMGDQGFWNYLLESEYSKSNISFQYMKFACYPKESDCITVTADSLAKRQGVQRIIHWAGQHNHPWLSQFNQSDILHFYENYYYSQLKNSYLKRKYRIFKHAFRRYGSLLKSYTLMRRQ
jgi:lipopolysaccharide biosynthesis glycosyltransferase